MDFCPKIGCQLSQSLLLVPVATCAVSLSTYLCIICTLLRLLRQNVHSRMQLFMCGISRSSKRLLFKILERFMFCSKHLKKRCNENG